jgi:hypothetical protein
MAVATVVTTSDRFELTTAPPDGYVVIRRMTWGEKLKRQGMMTNFRMDVGGNKKDDMAMDVNLFKEKVSLWEFSNLVLEHNLTDDKLVALNFKNPVDVERLGPLVGEEIQKRIDEINSFEESEEVKN